MIPNMRSEPRALVLAPGRELANQTFEMIRGLAAETNLKIKQKLAGNLNDDDSGETFEMTDVLVGTPGVLTRLVRQEKLGLAGLSHVVVDEADSLLDDSFSSLIIDLLSNVEIQVFSSTGSRTHGAQLILSAATFPSDLDTILEGVIDSENLTHVKTENLHRILPHVPQKFCRLSQPLKQEKLLELVKSDWRQKQPVLVFARDKAAVEWVYGFLRENDVDCGRLHGKMDLAERQKAFDSFQSGRLGVLVATDIGSRGLDTSKVVHVINFDFPRNLADYIHRVGRVGRVGSKKSCHVTSFVQRKYEVRLVNIIEEAVRKSKAVPDVDANIKRKDSVD